MQPNLEAVGKPSSIQAAGRYLSTAIEEARQTIADLIGAAPGDIIFTSGGTEADNHALRSAVETYGLSTILYNPTEHHAVLHTIEDLVELGKVRAISIAIDSKGRIDLQHLETLLKKAPAPAGEGSVGAYPLDACPVDADFVGAGSVDVGSVGAGSEPAPTGARDVIMMLPCTGFGMTTHTSNLPFGTWLGRSCQVHNPLTLIGTGTWDGIHHHVRRLPVHPYLPSISRISSSVRSYRR